MMIQLHGSTVYGPGYFRNIIPDTHCEDGRLAPQMFKQITVKKDASIVGRSVTELTNPLFRVPSNRHYLLAAGGRVARA